MKALARILITGSLTIAVGAGLLAQYALDANPRVGSYGRNRQTAQAKVSKPLYTVSSLTGDLVYNRTAAFNDTTYSMFDFRATHGYSEYSGQPARIDNRAGMSRGSSSSYTTGAVRPVSRGIGTASRSGYASPGTGATSLRRPSYSAARPMTNRAASGRVSAGRVSTKARR
jgi:hypothetical protein